MSQKDSMDNAVEAGVKRNKTQKERSNDMRQEKKVGGTKRALLTSVLALVLSLAMLAGTTFAWFTDTASTGVNRIVSGNLDVGLKYWGGAESGWLTAEDSKKLFDENALWEPGYTQIVYLKVENNGNLALTYAMQITPVHETVGVNVDGEEFKLSDYIKFGWTAFTVDGNGAPVALDREAAQTGVGGGAQLGTTLHRQAAEPLAAGAEELVALVAWMPENVGNEANYSTVQPTIELSLKVLATQAAVESDSFDNTYDEDAAAAEDLNNKPEYNYSYTEEEGVTLITDENGKVVKAIVSGVNGKVPERLFYNKTPGLEATPMDRWRDLKEVVIEEGVTEIGVDAFSVCTSLETVTLPESLQKIGEGAFEYCSSLNEIRIPENVTVIGQRAFHCCKKLTSVTIPAGVTKIDDATFAYCEDLSTVVIPETVTKIGKAAFQNCGFSSINIPATVKETDYRAFAGCHSMQKATISVETVGEQTFYSCDALTEVVFTSEVKTIGGEAFHSCTALAEIKIPDNVTSIGDGIFTGCRALKKAVFEGGTVKKSTLGNPALQELIISGSATLDVSFTAGYSKSTLETVKIGKGEIGDSAFNNCKNLTTVELGDGVTSIGKSAFLKCTQLPSITIGSGVTSIGTSAFNGCTALTNANIGSGAIGESAFNGCTSLANVTLGNGVTSIGRNAFLKCTALTSMNIGSSVKTIESYAFSGCEALKEVTISAAQVKSGAFSKATALEKVTFGNDVTNIAAGVFSGSGIGTNNGQLYLKAGTWTSNRKSTQVTEGQYITVVDEVFNQIVAGKAATWSAT